MPSEHTLRDAVFGAAVGDALGVPFESCQKIKEMYAEKSKIAPF